MKPIENVTQKSYRMLYIVCCNVVCSTQRGCLQAECCVRCPGVRSPVLHCSTAATNQLIPSQAAGGWTALLAAKVREDFTVARAFSLLNVSSVYTSTYFSNVRWQLYCLLQIRDTGSHVVPGLPLRPGQAGAVSSVQGRGGQGGVGLGGAQVSSVDNNIIRDICK